MKFRDAYACARVCVQHRFLFFFSPQAALMYRERAIVCSLSLPESRLARLFPGKFLPYVHRPVKPLENSAIRASPIDDDSFRRGGRHFRRNPDSPIVEIRMKRFAGSKNTAESCGNSADLRCLAHTAGAWRAETLPRKITRPKMLIAG